MDSFIYSVNATVPVFLVIVIGYIIGRLGIINDNFITVLNKYVFVVALPIKVALDMAKVDILSYLDWKYIAYCFFVTLVSILSIWALARKFVTVDSERGAFVQAAYRSSAAILGIAFIENVYGSSEMAPLMIIGAVPLYNIFAVVVLVYENPANHATGRARIIKACKGVVTNPIIIGIVLGMVLSCFFHFTQLGIPGIIDKVASSIAVTASPMALIAAGAGFRGTEAISKIKPTAAASLIKLVIIPAIFLPLAFALGFTDQKLLALIIMLGSPTTISSYIMASNLDGDAVLTSSVVVLTTMLSSVTLTFWIFVARSLGYM